MVKKGKDFKFHYDIGDVFTFRGKRLVTVEAEDHGCEGCYFYNKCYEDFGIPCLGALSVHGLCSSTDIGSCSSIKFIEEKEI